MSEDNQSSHGYEMLPSSEQLKDIQDSFDDGHLLKKNQIDNQSQLVKSVSQGSSIAGSEKNLFQRASNHGSEVAINAELGIKVTAAGTHKLNKEQSLEQSQQSVEKEKLIELVGEKIQNGWKQFVDLIKFKREYDSFGQLYTQIFFDCSMVYYFYRKSIGLQGQRDQSLRDENLVRECISKLSENPMYFFQKSQVGKKVLVSGRVNTQLGSQYLTSNQDYQQRAFNKQNNQKNPITVSIIGGTAAGSKGGNIDASFNSQTLVKNVSSLENPNNSQRFLTKITSTLLSLVSLNIFKTSIKIEPTSKFFSVSHYFFGQKIASTNGKGEILEVSQVFKEFNLSELHLQQNAFRISAIIAAGLGVYFAVKALRNTFFLAKKKKIYKLLKK